MTEPIDITRPIYPGVPVWPGDTPYSYELTARIAQGDSVNVGKITTTTHLGTHLDAPWHYVEAGEKLESVPLSVLVGPCRVVDARGQKALSVEFLKGVELAERTLFYTGEPNRWDTFPHHFMHVLPEAALYLAAQGVRLYGTDGPSVDPLTSKDLPAHRAFARGGVFILEGLALEGVPAGSYELIALPMRLEGADAAPVRAILR
ncbi:Kynurenine formamidase [Meiothermus luteus]|jgi:arylformamidase|uniref:Kynurenine formamidase n=1 Tax=Meiothermus luteus TaxID=2026184 RepID=A0A399EPT8_9DEIN|nr:cyclase family protein [Meiothermus luteus]RIH86647.1 Kynurenine formamidase [Meiothermus luteus]RMH58130.1 MAG: kynurenine formamidase [Deinococcota bacterium]